MAEGSTVTLEDLPPYLQTPTGLPGPGSAVVDAPSEFVDAGEIKGARVELGDSFLTIAQM